MTLCARIANANPSIGRSRLDTGKRRRRYPCSTPTSDLLPCCKTPTFCTHAFFHTPSLPPPSPAPDTQQKTEAETAEQLLERASSSGGKEPRIDGRAFRRSLAKTGRYVRNPANDAESLALMEEHGVGYSSMGLVAQMRKPENNNTWKQGNLTVTLAQAYGTEFFFF